MHQSNGTGDLMFRTEKWPEVLQAYLKPVTKEPFRWATFDCCMFAANAVKAMTGEDFAVDFRGQYDDGPSAYEALQRIGAGDVNATMDSLSTRFGWEIITNPLRTQRGDIVLLAPECCEGDPRFGGALGICVGTLCLFASDVGLKAISTIPNPGTRSVLRAWRIPIKRDVPPAQG